MSILWQPSEQAIADAQITRFQRLIENKYQASFPNYSAFHQWTTSHRDEFWSEVWDYCEVLGHKGEVVSQPDTNPTGTRWFPDAKLNFAENLIRYSDDHIALVGLLENGRRETWTYRELNQKVARLALS